MLKLKIPPVVVFLICIGMMWLINNWFPNESLLFDSRKGFILILIGIGVIIGILGLIIFAQKSTTVNPHKPQNTEKLVTTGVYQISRNPMYLALLLVLVSPVIYWGNVVTLIMLPLFVWYMNEFQVKPEEEIMEQKFGDEFFEYKKEVRRWV
jgi:protein-S-isoprenylcysteine O-methyltransferase Ste14